MTDPTERSEAETSSGFRAYVRERKYALFLLAAFMVSGAFVAPHVFPDLHPARAAVGGVIFGGFCAFCAAANRFL